MKTTPISWSTPLKEKWRRSRVTVVYVKRLFLIGWALKWNLYCTGNTRSYLKHNQLPIWIGSDCWWSSFIGRDLTTFYHSRNSLKVSSNPFIHLRVQWDLLCESTDRKLSSLCCGIQTDLRLWEISEAQQRTQWVADPTCFRLITMDKWIHFFRASSRAFHNSMK